MQLTPEQAEQLALDIAQGFFTDAQLCLRHDLTITQLEAVRDLPEFKKHLLEVDRVLNDGGEQFVHKARTHAARALDKLAKCLDNEEATVSLQMRAAAEIIEIAGLKRKNDDTGSGFKLTINTNLALGGVDTGKKGVYVIEAKPVHPAAPAMIERATQAGEDLL